MRWDTGVLRGIAVVVTTASLALAFTACSSGSGTSPGAVAANSLGDALIGPPAGFYTSTESDAINRKLTTKEFDDYLSDPTAAARTHLEAAYQATFDSSNDPDTSILVVLAEFATAADAAKFANLDRRGGLFRAARADSAIAPRISAVPGIRGSVLIDPQKPDFSDGTYDHAVAAVKGKRAMFIDYIRRKPGAIPALPAIARQQYARL